MEKFKSKKGHSQAYKIALNTLLIFVGLVMVLPVVCMVITSFKTFDDILINPVSFIPKPFTLDNYGQIMTKFPFFRYLQNSLLITVFTITGVTFSSAISAYGFTRFDFKYKNAIFAMFLATAMIPGQVLQIPIFEMYKALKWINTYNPLIIPPFFGGGIINIFLCRQFFYSLPKALYESAELDGAGELRIFTTVVLPLSKAVLLTVAIFTFVGTWNDFFSPLLYLNDEKLYTLAFGLYIFFDKFKVAGYRAWNLISSANLIVIFPIIILYFFAQKYFVEGITFTGIKG